MDKKTNVFIFKFFPITSFLKFFLTSSALSYVLFLAWNLGKRFEMILSISKFGFKEYVNENNNPQPWGEWDRSHISLS